MATLLAFRDGVKNFCSKYDKFVSPLCKFILAAVMFGSINSLTGYTSSLNLVVVIGAAFVCAFLSEAMTLAIGGLFAAYQVLSANVELGITFAVIFIIMYCIYIRFFPKTSWLIMYMPFFYMIKFPYFMPVLAGMTAGAAGIIPAAFGCVFYYFLVYTKDYVALVDSTEVKDQVVEGYKYMFEHLVQDKTLLLTIVVFAVVIVLTCIIYRMSFAYSWYVAIVTGGLVEIILFLVGTMSMEVEISLAGALLGSIIAILVAIVVQFFKTVVDYSSVENTQFEDDDYYYYVKAVPKVSSGNKNKSKNVSGSRQPQRRPAQQTGSGRPESRSQGNRPQGSRPQSGRQPSAGGAQTGSRPSAAGGAQSEH